MALLTYIFTSGLCHECHILRSASDVVCDIPSNHSTGARACLNFNVALMLDHTSFVTRHYLLVFTPMSKRTAW